VVTSVAWSGTAVTRDRTRTSRRGSGVLRPLRRAARPGRLRPAWFAAALNGIGATGFTISADWASKCKQVDAGKRYIQGCARSDERSVIYMKPVPVDVAASESARGVVIHE
jgi:hypothetical protein